MVDHSCKTLKDLEEDIVDNDEIINIVKEVKILMKQNRYNIDSIKDLKKEYPN